MNRGVGMRKGGKGGENNSIITDHISASSSSRSCLIVSAMMIWCHGFRGDYC